MAAGAGRGWKKPPAEENHPAVWEAWSLMHRSDVAAPVFAEVAMPNGDIGLARDGSCCNRRSLAASGSSEFAAPILDRRPVKIERRQSI
jgi:hypothetical protein